jgi:hypothetical protein
MVTDHRANLSTRIDLLSFLQYVRCTRLQFDLLRFMGRHPRAKMSLHVIAKAVGVGTIDLRDEVVGLIEKGILLSPVGGIGFTTYCLSSDHNASELICELANLDPSQAESLRKQLD